MMRSCSNCNWYKVLDNKPHNLCRLMSMRLLSGEDFGSECKDYIHPDDVIRTEEDLTRFRLTRQVK